MASIHKDPRNKSPFWYAAYTTSTGKRMFKSTKCKAHRAAWEVAQNLERAEQDASTGRLTESRLRDLLNDTMERVGGKPVPQTTVRCWFTKWLDDKVAEGALSENSRIAYSATIRLFLQHLGKRADSDLGQIQADDIQQFKQARIATGLAAKTIDRDLKVLRTLLKQARLHGHISNDPAQLVALVSKQSKRNVQAVARQTFAGSELDAIVAAATGEWMTAILIARYTGARLGDCVCMAWSNIDLVEKVIRYSDAKTHKNYVVPLHARLEKHFCELKAGNGSKGVLCPSLAQKQSGGKYGLSMEFRRIMARAEIDDRTVATKAVRKTEGKVRHLARRSFHSIRHSYNSELANTGASQEIRRKLVGHADENVNDAYTHFDVDVFRQAIDKLE